MPLVIVALAFLALLALLVVSVPLGILLRYRAGTARRPARRWVATMNTVAATISSTLFLLIAAITSAWLPRAFTYSAAGFACGCLLGFIGLAATRWEMTPTSVHFTPSRLLVLAISVVIAARLGYGFWRAWEAWQSTADAASWIAQSGAAGSMAAGAVVLGYYLVYWAGVRRRVRITERLMRRV